MSEHRDIAAAKRFFTRAIESQGAPEKITLDGYATSHTAVDKLKKSAILPTNVCVRKSKYLDNLIEQDHRRVKQRIHPLLGFKRFEHAAVTISGIELAHKIKKEPFDISTVERERRSFGKTCWLCKIEYHSAKLTPLLNLHRNRISDLIVITHTVIYTCCQA